MTNNFQLNQNNGSKALLETGMEDKLLASKLVSAVYKSPGHFSFTMTEKGLLAFAKAMKLIAIEESLANKQKDSDTIFPIENGTLISKKEAMLGFGVSHTTLWKWQKSGYLIPVKVGKRVYYKRSDIENLVK